MKIIIKVYNDEDEMIENTEALSFESAEEELGKIERRYNDYKAEIKSENDKETINEF